MKFLCVQCDEPMKLKEVRNEREIGSLSVIYECTSCLQEVAMLTNPSETQMINSLGVTISPQEGKAEGTAKCPFAAMFQGSSEKAPSETIQWNREAEIRLHSIPTVFREVAKKGVEDFAKEKGYEEITVEILEDAKKWIRSPGHTSFLGT